MSDILEQEEFRELLDEHSETPEVQAIIEELFSPEMMSMKMLSYEFQTCFKRLELQLVTLEKDDAIKRGAVKAQ